MFITCSTDRTSSTSGFLFVKLGDVIDDQIAAHEFANVHLFLDHAMHAKFNVSFTRNANIGLYANRNSLATFTQHEFVEVLNGKRMTLTAAPAGNSGSSMVATAFIHFMSEGLWYISIFNDNKTPVRFRLRVDYYGMGAFLI